jgi:hypothetical protein
MNKKDDRQRTRMKRERENVTLSFDLSNANQKNEKKNIHFDEKEKSALLFYVCVRSPIDNYENKE